jgi:PAS domain-containing protein
MDELLVSAEADARDLAEDGAIVLVGRYPVGLAGLLAAAPGALAFRRVLGAERQARERAERALSAEEARYRALAEASSQFTWVMRPDGGLSFASRSLRDVTGLEGGEIPREEWARLLHPEDRARA